MKKLNKNPIILFNNINLEDVILASFDVKDVLTDEYDGDQFGE